MRIVEAYIGEFASGKSENAINRALELTRHSEPVTLVDLDTVSPFYTLRPIKEKLEGLGLNVVAWGTDETMGLGEAGSLINQEMIWALRNEGNIILDIGYGVHGARIFNLIEGADIDPDLKVFAVVNAARPLTGTVEDIVEYVQELGHVDALINNTHLGDQTTIKDIQDGAEIVTEATAKLNVPVLYTAVNEDLANDFGNKDHKGNPVKVIKRFMTEAMW